MAMPGSVHLENCLEIQLEKKNSNSLTEILLTQRAKRNPFNKNMQRKMPTLLSICVLSKGTQKYFQLGVKAFYKVIM